MRQFMTRRQAIAGLGAALGLSACSRSDRSTSIPPVETTSSTTGRRTEDAVAPKPAPTVANAPTTPVTTAASVGSEGDPKPLSAADFGDAACSATHQEGRGPYYYYNTGSPRRNLTEGLTGVPLQFGVLVRYAETCEPVEGALVDIWHCAPSGYYAGFPDSDPDSSPQLGATPITSERFCRGVQPTDAEGVCDFITVYPGWYLVRAVHIHLVITLPNGAVFVTQAYFDDSVTDSVYAADAYGRSAERSLRNSGDGSFDEDTLIDLRQSDSGWIGTVTVNAI